MLFSLMSPAELGFMPDMTNADGGSPSAPVTTLSWNNQPLEWNGQYLLW